MKPRYVSVFALLDVCLGQRWKVDGGCSQYDSGALESAVTEAVTMAETAFDVLSNNFDDQHVQSMVKFILGDDAGLNDKVTTAKGLFEKVKGIDKDPFNWLSPGMAQNSDVLIFCDNSNYEEKDGKHMNKAIGVPVPDEHWTNIATCYDANVAPGGANELPMAVTTCSDGLDWKTYGPKYTAWVDGGKQGPMPDPAPDAFERKNKANTIDLCTWYLNNEKKSGSYAKVDKTMVARVQSDDFLHGLKGNDKAIDALSQTVSATLLHELTHTNYGGKTIDNPSNDGCYGWVCVGKLHDVNNADSINILGVAMTLWKMGHYVSDDGFVHDINV